MHSTLAQRGAPAPEAQEPSRIVHRQPTRVYWEDTDAGGIVFYANYLKFFERARTEWLRALGVQQQAMRERTGAIFVVTHTAMHYRAPARLDDLLEVTVALRHTGRVSLEVAQQAWRLPSDADADTETDAGNRAAPVLLVEGEVRIGCVDAATMRPCRIPADVLQRLP